MLLKETPTENIGGEEFMAGRGGYRHPPSKAVVITVIVIVILIVGTFFYFQYANYGANNNSLLIDWRLKITFADVRNQQTVNYTLPAGIGVMGEFWFNHTLDGLGPSGYAPLSTRDGTSTIWVQSTAPAIFTFGDFFNIWGRVFNETCVPDLSTGSPGLYCARAAEPIIYDVNGNSQYDPATDINVNGSTQLPIRYPPAGSPLYSDPRIQFVSVKNSMTWNRNETIVYDANNNGFYDTNVDPIIYLNGTSVPLPLQGVALHRDPNLTFYDWNRNGQWDKPVPPPVLSDGNISKCISRSYGLSKGYDWIVFLWSNLAAAETSTGCVPPTG
jgi:hypothetical protein